MKNCGCGKTKCQCEAMEAYKATKDYSEQPQEENTDKPKFKSVKKKLFRKVFSNERK